jgi:CheY-like chemotaxis protein
MKPKLLIVEDNELSSSLLFTIFDSLGFEVKEIANGGEVLSYLKTNKVDVMILDLELPGMTGDQIYASMKKDPALKKIPIVPFTAHNDTKSPDSYTSSLIWTEYQKSGKIPSIVYKFDDSGDSKNITKEIIDEVAQSLLSTGVPITKAMADYYLETRGLKPEDLMK